MCLARAELLAEGKVQQLAEIFKILGDPTRIRIVHLLSKQELCVCDIAATLQLGQSTVSHQLRILRGARVVKYRKAGKEAWYSLDDGHVMALLCQGLDHINHL
ncbi:MAG: metalloregulator ArsR/SmtB family transcription factor [Sporomusaceae bacterium]|nr:metalloregulator ArsR/SmtB family transcription factor [Sporomusaceae bacterium]